MMGVAHTIASRFAAAAVALALSGVPQLVEPPDHAVGHRCQCPVRAGQHDCDCPLCHAAAVRLGKSGSSGPSQPQCHRALAPRARVEDGKAAERRAASDPCLTSTCGGSDNLLRPPPAVDRFMLPVPPQLTTCEPSGEVPVARDLVISVLREPETPPPRGA
jgi:hypothetical protein